MHLDVSKAAMQARALLIGAVWVCACACVRVCVRACVRACVCVRMRVRAWAVCDVCVCV